MESIKIIGNATYLPKQEITNKQLAEKLNVTEQYIYQMTGIEKRHYATESIEQLAITVAKKMIEQTKINPQQVDMIVVATTSTKRLMPGISFFVQKELEIQECICMDILAGCSGYINAFDLARNYLAIGRIDTALVIGVEKLSSYTNPAEVNTAILLSDGAGATLLTKSKETKQYECSIESKGQKGELLTCYTGQTITMEGKAIYKYAITDTTKNIQKLLKKTGERIDKIKYIIPHQSNERILEKIAERLDIPVNKVYRNIKEVGNTFCASIPIALDELFKKGELMAGDKVILVGYGGGLNLGSILLEV